MTAVYLFFVLMVKILKVFIPHTHCMVIRTYHQHFHPGFWFY